MNKSLRDVRDEHWPSYPRRQRGRDPITGRPVYATSLRCSCGFEQKSNENKRYAESLWRDHTREVWNALRNPLPEEHIPDASTEPSSAAGMGGVDARNNEGDL